jgi:NhaC family Na+:H+ antiporter
MFRSEYQRQRLEPVVLSTSIADSGTIMSHIIPWNIHAALFAGTLGIATIEWAPYTFFAYLTPVVSFAIAAALSRKQRVPDDQDIDKIYGPLPAPTDPTGTA